MTYNYKALGDAGQAAALGLALSLVPAPDAQAENGIQTDRAVITIPAPQSANLLQLRGIGGTGSALLLIGGECHSLPVRLVAGDFEGRQTSTRDGEPIVMEIRDPALVQALLSGTDIVSGEMAVSVDPSDQGASILLLSGLEEGTGFVINPGRNLLSDIFGARASGIPCDVFERAQAAEPKG